MGHCAHEFFYSGFLFVTIFLGLPNAYVTCFGVDVNVTITTPQYVCLILCIVFVCLSCAQLCMIKCLCMCDWEVKVMIMIMYMYVYKCTCG